MADVLISLGELARERRPGDAVLAQFLPRYYSDLPDEDADDRRRDDLYAAGAFHLGIGRQRAAGEIIVRIVSPEVERDGWQSQRSVLLFVTDDIPFLVDTARIVLDRYDVGIHLLVHPTLDVARGADGEIVEVRDDPGDGGTPFAQIEAWTQIELDRCSPALCAELETEVHAALAEAHQVVADFESMQQRLLDVAEGDELLEWLAHEQFVFLGAVSYARGPDGLTVIEGSELGEYRPTGRLDPNEIDPPDGAGDRKVLIARTDAVAMVHRAARMMCIAVRGESTEQRFVGLLGSGAYRESVFAIPVLGARAQQVQDLVGASVMSHMGRAVKNVVETLPRDIVFELDTDTLAHLVIDIVGLQERRIVRIFDVAEPVGPWTTVLVYVPRARFVAHLPDRVAELVAEFYRGEVRDIETLLSTSSLARISMTVRAGDVVDLERLGELVDAASETWEEQARQVLWDTLGATEGERVYELVVPAAPIEYQARTRPADAVADLRHIAALADAAAADLAAGTADAPASSRFDRRRIATSFVHPVDASMGEWRFRAYFYGPAATISELVPILDQLGLHAVEERPSVFIVDGDPVSLYDIGVHTGLVSIDETLCAEVQRAFVGLVCGEIESDPLNRLVLAGGLTIREVAVIRLYQRYLRQVGFAFSPDFVANALVRQAAVTRALVELFDAKFDPQRGDDLDARLATVDDLRRGVLDRLDAIPSLDDDRACRAILTLIDATVRTSAFGQRAEIAVKLRPAEVSFVPEPRPEFEIFVCSPWVEAVHLRAGLIARGGLRWSDRAEDFRTEILGLVKAQMVKNAVIVPVGSKGGFVVKRGEGDPADGVDRYRRFVRSMLDLTDNVVDGEVVHPAGVVVHDGDDPYLVVAADKGTARFSDVANEIAAEYEFWLGDAFASGGSEGYDHKAMGITARGAWESVRRHARVLGLDADRDELTAVGIGDMSGDVFGNGMLLSPHLRLVGAFDHRHIFVDPDPLPEAAFAERRRLFELPRSSWADYDTSLISTGGGVYPRTVKSIPITTEARKALGIDAGVEALHPDELISSILTAPVDLLWNGGIGTYVKSETETNEQVGDRANDNVRVDGSALRCRIVGEGGNLGMTQLGRVEYALAGGLVNTDAIDNSAGVDCSDHEVNIKIALDAVVASGELTVKQRNDLLESMTPAVASMVLDNNRAQTLALLIAQREALMKVNVHARYLDSLESEGLLDRALEFLPTDKQMIERQSSGSGLVTPEFAVLIAYTKNADVADVLGSDLPDDPALEADLLGYFPQELRDRCPQALLAHRLRREIIATVVVNSMVNHAGISFDHRMTEDTGGTVADVTRAFVVARDVVGLVDQWDEIDRLGSTVSLDTQVDLFVELRRMAESAAGWFLRNRRSQFDIGAAVATFRGSVAQFASTLDRVPSAHVAGAMRRVIEARVEAGVPPDLATRSAKWPWLHPGFDVVEVAIGTNCGVETASHAYWSVFEALDLSWLWDGIAGLPRSDRWQSQARSALHDDLLAVLSSLARSVIMTSRGSTGVWLDTHDRVVSKTLALHNEIRRTDHLDLTTLSVGLRQLRNLLLATDRR